MHRLRKTHKGAKVLTPLAIASILLSTSASASYLPKSMLCTVEQSVGFYWEHGSWKRASYKGRTYVIRRADPVKEERDRDSCVIAGLSPNDWMMKDESKWRVTTGACYRIIEVGEKIDRFSACKEIVFKDSTHPPIVHCDDAGMQPFSAQPGGRFVMSATYGVYGEPPHDSVFVAIGKCSALPE